MDNTTTETERLQQELTELRAKVAKERRAKLADIVDGALRKHAAPGAVRAARTYLTHPETTRVRFAAEDSDDVVFVGQDGEHAPLARGLQAWLASGDGKAYAPTREENTDPRKTLRSAVDRALGSAPSTDDPRAKLSGAVERLLSGG